MLRSWLEGGGLKFGRRALCAGSLPWGALSRTSEGCDTKRTARCALVLERWGLALRRGRPAECGRRARHYSVLHVWETMCVVPVCCGTWLFWSPRFLCVEWRVWVTVLAALLQAVSACGRATGHVASAQHARSALTPQVCAAPFTSWLHSWT